MRLAMLVRWLDADESGLLLTGLALTAALLCFLGVCLVLDPGLSIKLLAVTGATLIGGRTAAIVAGLEIGLTSTVIASLLILVNSAWLLVVVPLFSSIQSHVVEHRMLKRFFDSVSSRAATQHRLFDALGGWALALFIWLPFPMTGGLAGAVIGLLLGLGMRRLMLIVLPSMWAGIVCWTYGFEYLFLFTGTTGKVICYGVTGAILIWSLLLRFRQPAGQVSS
jgi:uncharacterized membrane protein